MFFLLNKKKMCTTYISKVNSNCEKQIILLVIQNEKKEDWHYFSAKETD